MVAGLLTAPRLAALGLFDEEEQRRKMLGEAPRGLLSNTFNDAAFDNSPADPAPALPQNAPRLDPRVMEMVGEAPKKPQQWRQIAGGLLAAIGAASAYQNDNPALGNFILGNAVDQAKSARNNYQAQLAAFNDRRRIANLPGMTPREFSAYLANPEQWGSHMSDALSTHQAAANVGQTETRVFGNPNQGGSVYQPPRIIENGADTLRYDPMTGQSQQVIQGMTSGEQYARSLGLDPGSTQWNDALRDAMLRGSGPTAHGNAVNMEALRQQNRLGLEGARQGNRMQVRGSPTYRDMNPVTTAPRRTTRKTATGPNGEKAEYDPVTKKWVRVR